MHNLMKSHLRLAFRVLGYLKREPGLGISFKKNVNNDIKVFVDSDWAKCKVTRRPITVYSMFLGENLVSWKYLEGFDRFTGFIKPKKVKSEDNIADLFTKGLSIIDQNRFFEALGLLNVFQIRARGNLPRTGRSIFVAVMTHILTGNVSSVVIGAAFVAFMTYVLFGFLYVACAEVFPAQISACLGFQEPVPRFGSCLISDSCILDVNVKSTMSSGHTNTKIDPGNPSNRTCDFTTWYQEPKGSCNTTIHDSTIIQESNLRFLKKTRTWMPIKEDVELKEKSDHHRHLSRRRKPPDETKKIRTPRGEELTESPHK
ncbi:hypothetical protein Tco_1068941 [Tanacetum coccineum]|uniref:Uncharacterized protein n=1 Tax=Tanacetum coccineum TaxID=301880 RepID=A0ABQ5HIL3_9ASTR